MRFLTLILLYVLFSIQVFAQTGIIRGQVIDDNTGEALIGATVLVEGTSAGAAADLDGKFTINSVNPGVYNLVFSFVSYQAKTVQNVEVRSGEVTVQNVRMTDESIGLQEVVIQAEAFKNSESSLLTIQRKSSLVLDGISSEQFARSNDNDAAAAMRRVTGVSVEGGKYVYVRGLGDRYSKTTLNNAEIPGLDPNKNAVQMDLFPSNLIDNLVVYKTFSPELPASFSGGYVNITTKDFPDRLTLQASGSLGYNSNATFNNSFLSDKQGNTFFAGIDDGTHAMPDAIKGPVPAISVRDQVDAMALDAASKAFDSSFEPIKKAPFLNQSYSFSIGNQKTLFGRPLGFIGGLSYQRNYEFYQNGRTGRYFQPGTTADATSLVTLRSFSDTRGVESVLWGALLNTSYKINSNHKIGINFLRNQSADASSRFLQGTFPADANNDNEELQSRAIQYLERSLSSAQLRGEHAIGDKTPLKIDWLAAYTYSTQDEPDLRFFNNVISSSGETTSYRTFENASGNPARYFRKLNEKNIDFKLNFELPVKLWADLTSKIKFGGAYLNKERSFEETIIEYKKSSNAASYQGDVAEFFSESNLGLIKVDQTNAGPRYRYGITVAKNELLGGSYSGNEKVPAAYAMIDLQVTNLLKISTGARYEQTNITLTNASELLTEEQRYSNVKNNDILPAVNVTQQLKENMNLRFAYGRTIARPTFRELAQYTTFDFLGDAELTGNPDLERTVIDNVDIRWELFPTAGEIISISAFYKNFTNPIERATSPFNNEPKDGLKFVYRNVDNARVYGMEIEARKDLGFISPSLSNLKIGTNVSLIKSEVDINETELQIIRVNDPEASAKRELFGQSPYIVNAFLMYGIEGFGANLSYNVLGPRLSVVSSGGTPNIYEQPRNVLDLTIIKKIGNRFSTKLAVQNLLNPAFKFTQEFKDVEYEYQSYKVGRTVSFGISYLLE